MAHQDFTQGFSFGGPGHYRIVVKGRLDPEDSNRLAGMSITSTDTDKNQGTVTTLVGRLKDQAQLSGILNTLYEMHLTILTVQALAEGAGHLEKEEER